MPGVVRSPIPGGPPVYQYHSHFLFGTARLRWTADIGAMDLLIGAHALSLDVTLITNSTREFKRIKHLKTADWTK